MHWHFYCCARRERECAPAVLRHHARVTQVHCCTSQCTRARRHLVARREHRDWPSAAPCPCEAPCRPARCSCASSKYAVARPCRAARHASREEGLGLRGPAPIVGRRSIAALSYRTHKCGVGGACPFPPRSPHVTSALPLGLAWLGDAARAGTGPELHAHGAVREDVPLCDAFRCRARACTLALRRG